MPPLSPLTHEVRGDPIIYSAILCIALFPQSGDSSGAILGVRSVALLHVIDKEKAREEIGIMGKYKIHKG